ncbi:uracil-DNA glycosylase family protein [Vibrio agarivorans]|uniref:Uracil-DNA glycosylase family protein n=1 Tax=Vibrio agarivorans TaxID=153622 RepID=A0ABT7Y2L9_9VIBR|nr:uracil-DNA glycosylase family protein [Vibrio agarivorans]MDN2482286.1 uracil-DNA glycosylase family protein [Vibrio agarivorans]
MTLASFEQLLSKVRQCRACEPDLPCGVRPVIQAHPKAKLLIIGQAPGLKVHQTGIPWNDPSGDRLRSWLKMDKAQFYNPEEVAIVPMGLCYPGKGKSGDLPPRKECAPLWHERVLSQLPNIQLTLLIGQYAQAKYLSDKPRTLSETVKNYAQWQKQNLMPLPHPSPRNQIWLKKNPWFDYDVLPELQLRIKNIK